MKERSPFRDRVLGLVARIPPGKVATYGQLAVLAGYPRRARHVGYALAALPAGHDLPWHRVINAQGRVSPRGGKGGRVTRGVEHRQERLLKAEGVVFRKGRVELARYRWEPALGAAWVGELDGGKKGRRSAALEP